MRNILPKASYLPLIMAIALALCPCSSGAAEESPSDWQFHQIVQNESGYLISTGTDPYILFPEVDPAQNCTLNAVQFTIRLQPMPPRPFLMELFWRPEYEGFSEARKVFFVLHPSKQGDTIHFVIPLKHLAGFTQLRLDFPQQFKSAFRIDEYSLIPLSDLPDNVETIEPYYSYSALDACAPRVIIPHLVHTIQHGCARLTRDPVFLAAWLLFITLVLFSIRLVTRDIKKQEGSVDNG